MLANVWVCMYVKCCKKHLESVMMSLACIDLSYSLGVFPSSLFYFTLYLLISTKSQIMMMGSESVMKQVTLLGMIYVHISDPQHAI